MRNLREIKVWKKSHLLALAVYAATGGFPHEETYGLTAQLRRFMLIAMGSSSELEYQLLLAQDLGFLKADTYRKLSLKTQEVKRMLSPFINKLRQPPKKLTS